MKTSFRKACTLLVVLAVMMGMQSCQKQAEVSNGKANTSGLISKDIALIVAKRYNYHLFEKRADGQQARQSSQPDSLALADNGRKIGNVVTLYDKSLPAAYVVNYANEEGYLVVAADKNATPILAYITQGNFTDTTDAPGGMKEWVLSAVAQIDTIRTAGLQASPSIQDQWSKYSGGAVTYITTPINNQPCDYYYVNTYGPYTSSKWHQGCGFNDLTPGCGSGSCGHTAVGCVATAMSQLMYYYKWPANYNWSLMNATYGTPEAARLCRDAGSSVNMNYGCNGSSALGGNVPKALQANFNYKNTISRIDFGGQDLRNNLIYGKPILVEGSASLIDGHEWVCDGMQDIQWCNVIEGENMYGANTLYSMNWGWGGAFNGWYKYGAFNPGSYQYNKGVKAVINITPNR